MEFMTSEDYEEFIQYTFNLFDFDKSGFVDFTVFKMTMESFGKPLSSIEASRIESKIEKLGIDGVDYETFKQILIKQLNLGNSLTDLEKAFNILAGNEEPTINFEKLKDNVQKMQFTFTDLELKNIIKEFDKNKDGKISYEDLLRVYK